MKHYLNLVSISDKVHRRQSRMTRICIILAVFLVAVMFGLADMYLQSMTAETQHQTGDWHAKFSAIDEETSALIAARPEQNFPAGKVHFLQRLGLQLTRKVLHLSGLKGLLFLKYTLEPFRKGRGQQLIPKRPFPKQPPKA